MDDVLYKISMCVMGAFLLVCIFQMVLLFPVNSFSGHGVDFTDYGIALRGFGIVPASALEEDCFSDSYWTVRTGISGYVSAVYCVNKVSCEGRSECVKRG